ncbi:MAG: hypothetical protein JXR63_06030 [Spirochaetales bacterium]|nr:hypothetical protein [Spirochaetales bacterium]
MMKIKIYRSFGKRLISKVVLKVLGNAVEATSKVDKNIYHELEGYKEGCVVGLKAYPAGKTMFLIKEDGVFRYKGTKGDYIADYLIVFKSLDDSVPVFLGFKSIEAAYLEHRFVLEGDLMTSLGILRALGCVEAYLFPKFMLKKLFIKVPKIYNLKIVGLVKTVNTLFKNWRVV